MGRTPLSHGRRIQLVAGLLAPLIGFVVLLHALGNPTEALAITDSIPMLWLLAYALWRRRIEPVGASAAALSTIALLLTIALGGSPLPLELHHAVFPATVGLACLISLAARRPLLSIGLARLAKSKHHVATESRPKLDAFIAHGALSTLSAVIGVTLLTDAAAQIVLALTVSTSTFGVVARVAGHLIVGVGLAICVLYLRSAIRRDRERDYHRTPDSIGTPGSTSTPPPTGPREIPT
jgi:hypothetical protein